MVDEVGKINKKNAEYRDLIVENDHKLNVVQKEYRSLQKTIKLKDGLVERIEEEKRVLQKQFEKLVAQMKAESDSESADEIDFKTELVEKRILIKILESKAKSSWTTWKLQVDDAHQSLVTLQAQCDFSARANASLKDDYDLLQTKMDKYKKAANAQLGDRNEQIDKLNSRMAVLENFYDENQAIMADERKKNEETMTQYRDNLQLKLTETLNNMSLLK